MSDTSATLRHVLLVEDEADIRSMLAEELRDADLLVTETTNADQAWAFLAGGGVADLAFLDITMPGSMDGLELARKIRQFIPDMKIIISSGNPGLRVTRSFGIFLPKPYSMEEAVRTTLETLAPKA